jgi:thiol-disulfide isomerase/thioredoxin
VRVVAAAAALLLSVLAPGLLVACDESAADDDSEGSAGGSIDPTADTDTDYLTDADEAALGTDPLNPDTDGDTYLDGDEVLESTDPLDPASRIYRGGWPYQRNKSSIADPGWSGGPAIGSVAPRFIAIDQFGEEVDLYDFALHDKPIVIDLSAIWCDACKDVADWLGGEPSMLDDQPDLAPIVDMVDAGQIYWITVIFEDGAGAAADPANAKAWADAYPQQRIAVLADNDRQLFDYLFPGGYPSLQVLNPDMTFRFYDRFDWQGALRSLLP